MTKPGCRSRRQFLRSAGLLIAGAALSAGGASAEPAAPVSSPNVVLIFVDDMGYGDPGCYGGASVPTPHIDALAAEGARFTQGYAASPLCGPSRVGLLTGAYPSRFGVRANPDTTRVRIPETHPLLPATLRDAGYTTAVVGKWNLVNPVDASADDAHDVMLWEGDYWPDEDNVYRGVGGGWGSSKVSGEWGPDRPNEEYLTDRLTRHAVDFIDRHHDRPFFLYAAYNAPHSPLQAKAEHRDRVAHLPSEPERLYGAMLLALDEGVGQITDALRRHGLEDSTLVVFASDNGPARPRFKGYQPEWPQDILLGSPGPLRGHKSSYYEGGIRVPFIVKWPGVVEPGAIIDAPVSTIDLYPTFGSAAGVAPPPSARFDGIDLLPLLRGESVPASERELFWWAGDGRGALRRGDWKLVTTRDGDEELYRLDTDPAETDDLADRHPDRLRELREANQNLRATMPPRPSHERPIVNPGQARPLDPVLTRP